MSLLIGLLTGFAGDLYADSSVLNVGFIAPLSGPAASYGAASKNGFELALSELNDKSIRVVWEDDQFNPAKSVSAFQKLVSHDAPDVVICVGSATCNALAPLAEAKSLPLIGFASDPVVSKNRPHVVRSYPSGQEEGRRTAEEAKKRKLTKVGVLTTTHDYTLSWREGLIAELPPGTVVLDEQVMPDLQDFKAILLKARQKGIESFLVCALPGQSGNFARQVQESGLPTRIGGCFFLEDENEVKLAKGALDDAWFVTVAISPDFLAKYKAKFGNVNTIAAAAVNYDVAKILVQLAKQPDRSKLIENLMALPSMDAAAGYLSMQNDDGDRFFSYALTVKKVAGSK